MDLIEDSARGQRPAVRAMAAASDDCPSLLDGGRRTQPAAFRDLLRQAHDDLQARFLAEEPVEDSGARARRAH
jgi:hypothetical protein